MLASEVKALPLDQQIIWLSRAKLANINALVSHYDGHIPDLNLANAIINRLIELTT